MPVSKRRTASHNKPGTGIVAIPGRQVPCERCPLRGMEVLRDFSPDELSFVSTFKSGELNIEAGTSILLQGDQQRLSLHRAGGLGDSATRRCRTAAGRY